jgi:hypothetical protein
MRHSWLKILVVLLLAAVGSLFAASRGGWIASKYDPLAPLDLADPPNPVTAFKLWMMDGNTGACVAAMRNAGVSIKEMPRRTDKPGCIRDGTVVISQLSRASLPAEEMGCGIALRLYLLERHDIQPLARKHFGKDVAQIKHFGSYSCRTIAGSNRLSEHATANAFDISSFSLADGSVISLKRHWPTNGASSRFLKELRGRACLLFNMVLSPDYNEAHADHFHVDMGWFMGCH